MAADGKTPPTHPQGGGGNIDRQTHRHTYINQYKHIVIPIHGCICVTYPPFGWGDVSPLWVGGWGGTRGGWIIYYTNDVSLHVCKVCRHHLFAWRRSLLPYQGCNLLCTLFADFILPRTSIMRISRWLHAKHCKLPAHPTDNLGAHLDRNMPQAKNCRSTVVSAVSTAESLAAKTRKRCRNQRQRLPRILLKAKPSLLIRAVRRTTRPLGETDEAMVKRSKEVHSRKLTWQWKITIFKNRRYIFKWSIFHCHLRFREGNFLPALVRSNPLTP